MDAYVIIGNANTRKSSVLRSLTGCFNRSNRDIQLLSKINLRIYARVSSLQESKIEPKDFIKEVVATGQSSVVFCLWPHANAYDPARYPAADVYIAEFAKAGWVFQASAVLGASTFAPATPRPAHFPNAPSQPINVAAQAVRLHFGWL